MVWIVEHDTIPALAVWDFGISGDARVHAIMSTAEGNWNGGDRACGRWVGWCQPEVRVGV